jgi:AcrR family transcriptional regulator
MTTKQLIIQAAARLFAEKGYEGMTMKEIAREVGIKAPSLYAFFESKEDIFAHISRNVMSDHLELAQAYSEDSDLSVREQMERMMRMIMNFQLKETLQMKIYMRLLLFPPEVFQVDLKTELRKLEQVEQELFSRMFQRGIERGEIRQTDSDALAKTLILMMDGWFWLMQRVDEQEFWDRFETAWNQFWEGIKA